MTWCANLWHHKQSVTQRASSAASTTTECPGNKNHSESSSKPPRYDIAFISSRQQSKLQPTRTSQLDYLPHTPSINFFQNKGAKHRKILRQQEATAVAISAAPAAESEGLQSAIEHTVRESAASIVRMRQDLKKTSTTNAWLEYKKDHIESAMATVAEQHPNVPEEDRMPLASTILSTSWNSLKDTNKEAADVYFTRAKEKNLRPEIDTTDLTEDEREKLIRDSLDGIKQLQENLKALNVASNFNAIDQADDKVFQSTYGESAHMMVENLLRQNLVLCQLLTLASQMVRHIPQATQIMKVENTIAIEDYKLGIKKIVNNALSRAGKPPVKKSVDWKSLLKFKLHKRRIYLSGWPENITFGPRQKLSNLKVLNSLMKDGLIRIEWGSAAAQSENVENFDVNESVKGDGETDVLDWEAFNIKFHSKYGFTEVQWLGDESQVDLDDAITHTQLADENRFMFKTWVKKLCDAKIRAGLSLLATEAEIDQDAEEVEHETEDMEYSVGV
ncbi:hypothetical protein BCR33DRAFT_783498 [Rhizoclosmatium globosum]|uniref:Uncharacterized protein n=1 Tax=Rhizoclosmatium globosum TaxID=329046 RepID=A0A1Y2CGZ4_9FUNG|nr:hypothetical protein BCR33DRAFT_783498 [Rhizoclosmatium globosum]|eukprot:ORY46318.1 hypothetical protein BCR33DRAFT_783498 [Rhizoclosmatium globosum]